MHSFRGGKPAAQRRLIVVDIENVVGGACVTTSAAKWARRVVEAAVRPRIGDLVVVGTSHIGFLAVGCGWPGARYVVRSGTDGADLALGDVLDEEVGRRFAEVVIVSGDGFFARRASGLKREGMRVTVAAHQTQMSRLLATAASDIVYLCATPSGAEARRSAA